MALFRSDPHKAAQREIDNAHSNHDRLAAKLVETNTAIDKSQKAAHALARDGADDDVLARAEAVTRAAQDRAATVAGAIIEIAQQLTLLERERDDQIDKKRRVDTAIEIEAMATGLETVANDIDPVLDRMIKITEQAAAGQIWEATGLYNDAVASRTQIPDAISMVVRALREHRSRVLDKRSPASLQKPVPRLDAVDAVVAPARPTADVFTYTTQKHGPTFAVPNAFAKEKR
jgi:hypothetical protein